MFGSSGPGGGAVRDGLLRRSKEDLVTLIEVLLDRAPHLRDLLEIPAPGGVTAPPGAGRRARDPSPQATRERIAGQVEGVFAGYDGDWQSAATVVDGLQSIAALGQRYLAAGDLASALAVYATLTVEGLPRIEEIDDDGQATAVMGDAVDALAALLTRAPGATSAGALGGRAVGGLPSVAAVATTAGATGGAQGFRAQVIDALYEAVEADVTGDWGAAERATTALRALASPTERQAVAERLRALAPAPEPEGATHPLEGRPGGAPSCPPPWTEPTESRQHVAERVLELLVDDLDDEAYLRECRAFGHLRRYVDRLLQRSRFEEAVAEMEAALHARSGPAGWRAFADELVHLGQGERAEAYVARALQATFDTERARWLAACQAGRGEWAGALDLRTRAFTAAPRLADFEAAREAAVHLGCWAEQRPRLLAAVRAQPRPDLLAECLLADADVIGALAVVNAPQAAIPETVLGHVAVAAAAHAPAEALPLFRRLAEGSIGRGNREAYRVAVAHLQAGVGAAQAAGVGPAWHAEVIALLQQYRRLRALQDEARAAGLITR